MERALVEERRHVVESRREQPVDLAELFATLGERPSKIVAGCIEHFAGVALAVLQEPVDEGPDRAHGRASFSASCMPRPARRGKALSVGDRDADAASTEASYGRQRPVVTAPCQDDPGIPTHEPWTIHDYRGLHPPPHPDNPPLWASRCGFDSGL